MSVEAIVALGGISAVAVTALVVAIMLVRYAMEPWRLARDETAKRVRAEADRDAARQAETRLALLAAEKDRTIREQARQIADEIGRSRPAPGHGTGGLREQLEAEAGGPEADAADLGGDPSGPVPRVTTPGPGPGGPLFPR